MAKHFEEVPLTSIKDIAARAASAKDPKSQPYLLGTIASASAVSTADPIEEHFRRTRLPSFDGSVQVRSECVLCGEAFTGDIRDGIMESESQHILKCPGKK
jgi:hypothetical protein